MRARQGRIPKARGGDGPAAAGDVSQTMWRRNRPQFLASLALLWLALVISLYYVSHKPVTLDLALGLGRAAWQTIAAFGIVAVAGGIGARLMPAPRLRPLTGLALQAALGLGLLSLGLLAAGALAGIRPLLLWPALLGLGILFRRDIRSWLGAWDDLARIWRESDGMGRAIAAGTALILAFTWLVALAPPVKFDALVYHLALPNLYLESGRVNYIPENMFWGMPQVVEMLYTWAAALAGAQAAVVLGWLAGGLALAGLLGFCVQSFGPRPGWTAVASLLSGQTLVASLAWGYVDWFTILFGLGFLVFLQEWRTTHSHKTLDLTSGVPVSYLEPRKTILHPGPSLESPRSSLAISGIFAGLALGSKYTAGVLVLAGLAAVLWTHRRDGLRAIAAPMLRFGLPAVLVSLPWWVKNALATGNPFYPFFFPSGAMSQFRLDFYQISLWGSWQEALLLLWRATLLGLEGAPGYSASIGPLLLALGPLACLGWASLSRGGRAAGSTAGLVALAGLLVWAIAGRLSGFLIQSRLYWAIFPALAVLAAAGFRVLDELKLPQVRVGRVAGALVLVVLALSVLRTGAAAFQQGAPQVLLSLVDTEEYLADNLGWYAPAMQAVHDLPAEARVVMLWEPRSLYCAPKCLPDEVLDRWLNGLNARGSPDRVLQSWREAGYSHLLYNRFGADFVRGDDVRYSASDWQVLDDLLAQLPPPLDFGGAYLLYPLSP